MLQTGKVGCSNCVAEAVRKTRNENNFLQRESPPKKNKNKNQTSKPHHNLKHYFDSHVVAVCSVTCKYWDALTSRIYFCPGKLLRGPWAFLGSHRLWCRVHPFWTPVEQWELLTSTDNMSGFKIFTFHRYFVILTAFLLKSAKV